MKKTICRVLYHFADDFTRQPILLPAVRNPSRSVRQTKCPYLPVFRHICYAAAR